MAFTGDVLDSLASRFGRGIEEGQVIYEEGAPASDIYIVVSGLVRSLRSFHASERLLRMVKPGQLFGTESLMDGARSRFSTAVAQTDGAIVSLSASAFVSLASERAFAGEVMQQLARRIRELDEKNENLHLGDQGSRVVNTLLRLFDDAPDNNKGIVVSPLELSTRVGLDVDTVKRAMQRLREGGYVKVRDERLFIDSPNALRRLYDMLVAKERIRTAGVTTRQI